METGFKHFSLIYEISKKQDPEQKSWQCLSACVENLMIACCVNYRNIPDYCCLQSAFFVIVTETWGILWCRKGKAFCERPFTLHRQQIENKQMSTLHPWKDFCGRPNVF